MLKNIWVIARNTFRETIRDRVLYSLIGFSVLVIAASLLAGSVSLGQELRVIQNFGLTAMLAFLLVITIFIGTQLFAREIESKTVQLVLSKPVSRESFYLGKFVGLALTLLVSAAIMGAIFLILVSLKGRAVTLIQILAIVFMVLEVWLLTAVGMLFSAFTSPFSSAIYTFALFLIGHSSNTLWAIAHKSESAVKYLLQGVYYLFPNLEKFNLRNDVVFGAPPDVTVIWTALAYFVGYTAFVLILGIIVIRKDEF